MLNAPSENVKKMKTLDDIIQEPSLKDLLKKMM